MPKSFSRVNRCDERMLVGQRWIVMMQGLVSVSILAVLALSVGSGLSFAGDVQGEWRIHWPNGTVNSMTVQGQDALSGVYVDDSGNSCRISGKGGSESLSFRIQCQTWKADCMGRQSLANVIEGPFQTDVGVSGKYRMVRGSGGGDGGGGGGGGGIPTSIFKP